MSANTADTVSTNVLLDRMIPAELGCRLQETTTLDRLPSTLQEFATLLSATISGVTLGATVLCYAGPSRHELVMAGETRTTHCVLDALLLPLIEATPGIVRSLSPGTGQSIEFQVSPSGTTADPPGAVISLGVRRTGSGSFYELGCPYINAFPSEDQYADWATATPEAITMSISLDEAVALARELATSSVGPAAQNQPASTSRPASTGAPR